MTSNQPFPDLPGNRSPEELLALARAIGWGAADILKEFYRDRDFQIKTPGGGDPVTSADIATNHYILDNLQASLGCEDFAYLTEETFQHQPPAERLGRPWVWVIDPLDGTRDFIEKTGEYAIHIALLFEQRPVLSVVVWPEQEKLYFATLGGGAFVETKAGTVTQLQVSPCDRPEDLTLVGSRSHRDARLEALLKRLPCQKQRAVGSVGCKVATIVEQQAEVYISLSGKSAPKDWDMAAPELILTEAGGQFTYFDGSPLLYNREDVSQWGGILASNGLCHSLLLSQASSILAEIDRSC